MNRFIKDLNPGHRVYLSTIINIILGRFFIETQPVLNSLLFKLCILNLKFWWSTCELLHNIYDKVLMFERLDSCLYAKKSFKSILDLSTGNLKHFYRGFWIRLYKNIIFKVLYDFCLVFGSDYSPQNIKFKDMEESKEMYWDVIRKTFLGCFSPMENTLDLFKRNILEKKNFHLLLKSLFWRIISLNRSKSCTLFWTVKIIEWKFGLVQCHINNCWLFNAYSILSYLPNPSARTGYDIRSIFLSGV